MVQASKSGVAPPIHYYSLEKNLSIMAYIDAQPLPFFSHGTGLDVSMLADVIATLHSGEAFPSSYSVFNMLDYLNQAVSKSFSGDRYVERALGAMPLLQSVLDVASDRRPSHRDCHGFNVVYDGRQYFLIDWESAGNDSLYFDLAVASNMLLFNIPQSDSLLLRAYFKAEPTQVQVAKFKLMRVFAYLYYGFVLLYLGSLHQEVRLTEREVMALKPFHQFIEQQIKDNQPNMAGRYLRIGYAAFLQGINMLKTDGAQQAMDLLQVVGEP